MARREGSLVQASQARVIAYPNHRADVGGQHWTCVTAHLATDRIVSTRRPILALQIRVTSDDLDREQKLSDVIYCTITTLKNTTPITNTMRAQRRELMMGLGNSGIALPVTANFQPKWTLFTIYKFKFNPNMNFQNALLLNLTEEKDKLKSLS